MSGANWRSDEAHKASLFSKTSAMSHNSMSDPSFNTDTLLGSRRSQRNTKTSSMKDTPMTARRNNSNRSMHHLRLGRPQPTRFRSLQYAAPHKSSCRSFSSSRGRGLNNASEQFSGRTSYSRSPASHQVKNNRIFVYKIIHDLRHPTDSLQSELQQLTTDLANEKYKRDSNLMMNDQKTFKYSHQNRVKHAVQYLRQESIARPISNKTPCSSFEDSEKAR